MPALLPQASAGLFGKLPSRGDFVREGLSRGFTDAWDEWWQRGLAATQERPEEEWLAAWLEAPVWRFVLPPGLLGSEGVLGLWLPSVDKVGRYYPLTIAAEAQGDWAPLVGAMEDFLASAEEAGRDALEIDLEPSELGRRVREAFVVGEPPPSAVDVEPGRVSWWTDGGPRVAARVESGAALPVGARFAALMNDEWGAS